MLTSQEDLKTLVEMPSCYLKKTTEIGKNYIKDGKKKHYGYGPALNLNLLKNHKNKYNFKICPFQHYK